jgi:hypothetical protein
MNISWRYQPILLTTVTLRTVNDAYNAIGPVLKGSVLMYSDGSPFLPPRAPPPCCQYMVVMYSVDVGLDQRGVEGRGSRDTQEKEPQRPCTEIKMVQ